MRDVMKWNHEGRNEERRSMNEFKKIEMVFS